MWLFSALSVSSFMDLFCERSFWKCQEQCHHDTSLLTMMALPGSSFVDPLTSVHERRTWKDQAKDCRDGGWHWCSSSPGILKFFFHGSIPRGPRKKNSKGPGEKASAALASVSELSGSFMDPLDSSLRTCGLILLHYLLPGFTEHAKNS